MSGTKKVAILGGGVGAMTAAYWLTSPEAGGQYDVTIYQLGWRLGGKGASGRKGSENRIEEHGLHIWMGFYENAFRMMIDAYGHLDAPAGAPLRTVWDAFKPHHVVTLMETYDEKWQTPWISPVLKSPGLPGVGDAKPYRKPCEYITSIAAALADRIDGHLKGNPVGVASGHEAVARDHLSTVATALRQIEREAAKLITHIEDDLLRILLEGLLVVAQKAIGLGFDLFHELKEIRRLLLLADFGVATALGLLRDLCGKPWDAIDDQEWHKWLIKHGIHKQTQWNSSVRAVYDLAFGYRDGIADEAHADMAAGSTTCGVLRMTLDYKGAFFWKMQAGMGDTIFAPLYTVLKKRGVKFKYFHRLREVVPSQDGMSIDSLHLGVQATVKDGKEYDPLIDVAGVPSWPAGPLYDQLVEGADLQSKNIDLESYSADWKDVASLELRKGHDFDQVVFGLSLGAVPIVCPQLVQQKPAWRDMVEHVKVVRTQAFQYWLTPDIKQLGYQPAIDGSDHGERTVLGTYVEPMDTWADMSQLIPRETWNVPVGNVAYFCGVMTNDQTLDDVIAGAKQFTDYDLPRLWTLSAKDNQFNYQLLAVNDPKGQFTDDQRFRSQFFRANTEPTELYVLTVAGSTKYRLKPDQPGYDNLVLAGDWVYNGFPLGCVESAVLGGMKGVQRLVPNMKIVE
jgi:uncharacterized protein with NAD-binding domain and iron-sulfur cluster